MQIITRHAPWTTERMAAYTAMAEAHQIHEAAHNAYHSCRVPEMSDELFKAERDAYQAWKDASEHFSIVSQGVIREFEAQQGIL
jgi:hypothetical protein